MIISGYFDEALGIGRAGRLVANRLEELGYDVIREDLRPFDHGLLRTSQKSFPGKAPVWLITVNPPEAQLAFYGHRPDEWKDAYRIGIWHWESSRAPDEWVPLAPYFHEIWVPSAFAAGAVKGAFDACGQSQLSDRVQVHALPVEIPPSRKSKRWDNKIQVLTMFDPRSHFERKNPAAVIDVWLALFPQPETNAQLTIKTLEESTSHPLFEALTTRVTGRNDIQIRAETLDAAGTDAMINDCDIMMSLHRGEGYGLPLAEAMAAGKAVLATGWSGNMQFMTPENSWPVPFDLVSAPSRYNGPAAHWAEPNLQQAAIGLKSLIESENLRCRLGTQARRDMVTLRDRWREQAAWLK
ncbi:glycosyltransferase [Asticcacaulis taihuensis]|nr:glycosyltransferase [Asticcacaulis taihuensis]